MGNTSCVKKKDEQNTVDTQELNNRLHNATDTNTLSTGSLAHEGMRNA